MRGFHHPVDHQQSNRCHALHLLLLHQRWMPNGHRFSCSFHVWHLCSLGRRLNLTSVWLLRPSSIPVSVQSVQLRTPPTRAFCLQLKGDCLEAKHTIESDPCQCPWSEAQSKPHQHERWNYHLSRQASADIDTKPFPPAQNGAQEGSVPMCPQPIPPVSELLYDHSPRDLSDVNEASGMLIPSCWGSVGWWAPRFWSGAMLQAVDEPCWTKCPHCHLQDQMKALTEQADSRWFHPHQFQSVLQMIQPWILWRLIAR